MAEKYAKSLSGTILKAAFLGKDNAIGKHPDLEMLWTDSYPSESQGKEFKGKSGLILAATGSGPIKFVPVTTGALKLALDGSLGASTKNHIAKKIEKAAATVLVEAKNSTAHSAEKQELLNSVLMTGATKFNTGKVPPTPSDLLKKKKAIVKPLFDATELYAPVPGTSSGSIYHTVAISPHLKIAVRFKDKVSIRAEGDIMKFSHELKACGFEIKNESYASRHFDYGGDLFMAKRAIGAMIMGLGIEMSSPIPNLTKIYGKGAVGD